MHLPAPTITFTIPSIQDDLPIECRIYHPTSLSSQTSAWRKRAAIVAHPYAPLGGCYDDPVVNVIAATILNDGWVVGTFNFRGAGNSKGHTSWQSKPEQNDYISFIAFMVFYIHHLCIPYIETTSSELGLHDLSPVRSQALPPPHQRDFGPFSPTSHGASERISRLLLAGYSYGALIATYLPSSLSSIIETFQSPTPGSPHAEIRLRALHLAQSQNALIALQLNALRSEQLSNPKIRGCVRVGGEEDIRRASYDSHRAHNSFNLADTPERVRRSFDRVRSIARDRTHNRLPSTPKSVRRTDSAGSVSSFRSARENASSSSHSQSESFEVITSAQAAPPTALTNPMTPPIPRLLHDLKEAYLLVSPPINFLSTLATFFNTSRSRDAESHSKLVNAPTLALFGDDDSFVSVRRFRAWAAKLASSSSSSSSSSSTSPSSNNATAAAAAATAERENPRTSPRKKGQQPQPQYQRQQQQKQERGGFRHREVPSAGHFWHDREAIRTLRDEVAGFVAGL